jgi:hypothetical protein
METRKDTFHPERKIFQSKVNIFNAIKLLLQYKRPLKSRKAPSKHLMRWMETVPGNFFQLCFEEYVYAAFICITIIQQNSISAFLLNSVSAMAGDAVTLSSFLHIPSQYLKNSRS